MQAFLQLMAILTALTSVLTFLVGVVNQLFGWNLGLGIGGFDIELPNDFTTTTALAVTLLLLAGLFELIGNFKNVMARIKARPALFATVFLVLIGSAGTGFYQVIGGSLGFAVESGDTAKVSALVAEEQYSPTVLGEHLYQTLKRNDLQMSEVLLKAGADINRASGEFQTPLLTSACIYFPKEAVLWLVKHGADPNRQDTLGRTPAFNLLQYRSGHFPQESEADLLEILEALRKGGADFSVQAEDGRTAKTLADEKNSPTLKSFFDS